MFPSSKDEHKLIASWKNGDEKAFDKLFSLHFAKIHQFALRHTGERELSEELAMDTMLKVWRQKDTVHSDVISLAPLLFRILQVSIVDHYRKRKLEITGIEELTIEPQSTEEADSRLLTSQLNTLYKNGLDQLTPRQKLVFEMRNQREMSYSQIAGELDLSAKTVDRHLSDAVISIRKHVSKFLPIGISTVIYHLFF
jgi:RNA polymerase sigma-70 factor (ECF subfamily)